MPVHSSKVGGEPLTRRIMAGAAGFAIVATGVLAAQPFAAAAPASAVSSGFTVFSVNQTDGTADVGDPTNGPWANDLDTMPDNGIVRTNDLLIWTVSETTAEAQLNTTLTVTLPRGVYFDALSENCGPGSTLTPATVPPPAAAGALTATSWESLPQQTLTCTWPKADAAGASLMMQLSARVRPEVRSDTSLTASFTLSSDANPTGVTTSTDFTVVSKPQYDISLNGFFKQDDPPTANSRQAAYQSGFGTCANPQLSDQTCTTMGYAIMISSLSRKGVSPAASFTFIDNVTPTALWGQAVDDPSVYGPWFVGVNSAATYPTSYNSSVPGGKVRDGVTTADNAVSDTGTVQCSQEGKTAGNLVNCTVSGGDYSAFTVPTKDYGGGALGTDQAPVASFGLQFQVPATTFLDYGTVSNNGTSFTLTQLNQVLEFDVVDIFGAHNMAGANDPNNDVHLRHPSVTLGSGYQNSWVGLPGMTGNSPASVWYPGWNNLAEGPAQAHMRGGDGLVVADQQLVDWGYVSYMVPATGQSEATSIVSCQYWDNSLAYLDTTLDYTAGTNASFQNRPAGRGAWISAVNNIDRPGWNAGVALQQPDG